MFSPFDPEQKTISEDILSYLSEQFRKVRKFKKDDYVIRIESDSSLNEENIRERITEHINNELYIANKDLRGLWLKAICLGVFGFAVLSIWFALSATKEGVGMEVLSIIGWVAIWEATGIIIMQRHDLNVRKKDLRKMLKAEIRFLYLQES